MGVWTKMTELVERLAGKIKEKAEERSLREHVATEPLDAVELASWFDAAGSGDAAAIQELFEMNPRLLNCHEPMGDNDFGNQEGAAGALYLAAAGGHLEALNLLLSLGADARAVDSSGMDALMLAASNREWGAIRALLPVSDAKRKTTAGGTALMWAAMGSARGSGSVSEWRELALKSEPAATDQNGCTALIMAARAGNIAATGALLSLTSMETKDDEEGLRAWEWAWENKHFVLLDMMAAHPASDAWRSEVVALVKNGPLNAEDLPKTWALHEARELREVVAGMGEEKPIAPSARAARRI